jgi:hypothetical protein
MHYAGYRHPCLAPHLILWVWLLASCRAFVIVEVELLNFHAADQPPNSDVPNRITRAPKMRSFQVQ